MTRRINAEGRRLVKQWESFIPFAYDDFDSPKRRRKIQVGDKVNGTLTIGYGSTGVHVKPSMTISEAEASELLLDDLDRFERWVERKVVVPLNDNQFAALVSFCFNVGEGAFAGSTLLKKLNGGDYESVPSELMKWVNSKKKRMPEHCLTKLRYVPLTHGEGPGSENGGHGFSTKTGAAFCVRSPEYAGRPTLELALMC